MFGFIARNNYGEILFSDSSYVLEFVGKAVWQERFNFSSPGNINPRHWKFQGFQEVLSRPYYIINRLRIFAPSTDLLCFSYVPWPSFTAILYTRPVDSATTDLLVVGQVFDIPEVYCFRRLQPRAGGHGVLLKDAQGNTTFTTEAPLLVPRAAANIFVPYTDQATRAWSQNSSFTFATNGANENINYTTNNTFLHPAPQIQKPAAAYYAPITAVVRSGVTGGIYDFVESAVRVNLGAGIVEHQWGFSAQTSISSTNAEIRVPQNTQFCMVIDGAAYD